VLRRLSAREIAWPVQLSVDRLDTHRSLGGSFDIAILTLTQQNEEFQANSSLGAPEPYGPDRRVSRVFGNIFS
jgi:hypothetical protein